MDFRRRARGAMNQLLVFGRLASSSLPLRFLAVGILNTLFGYSVFVFGLVLRLAPEMALLIATAVGAAFNYFTTARYAFRYQAMNRFPMFVAVYALIYGVNAGTLRVLLRLGTAPALAQALLVPAMAVLSFVLFRTLVFKPVRLG